VLLLLLMLLMLLPLLLVRVPARAPISSAHMVRG